MNGVRTNHVPTEVSLPPKLLRAPVNRRRRIISSSPPEPITTRRSAGGLHSTHGDNQRELLVVRLQFVGVQLFERHAFKECDADQHVTVGGYRDVFAAEHLREQ